MYLAAMPRTSSGITFEDLNEELKSDELVKRLKNCQKSLEECENRNDADLSSLCLLSSALIQPFLISHRAREVKSLVACCIADIFRVSYPESLYDGAQRKTVFTLFVNQMEGLKKPSSPGFKYCFQLLETLATIRLFNLCIEMDYQGLTSDIFKMLFSVIGHDVSTNVKNYIADILSAIVQEAESLPQEVIDIILSNILEPMKSESKSVYTFTADFIRNTSSNIEPYIHLFFNNALVGGKSSESEMANHLYELILELHTIDSSVLLAVMPQLEFKLRSTETSERFDVTKLLARMFSLKGSKLATENRPLWNCFLGRFMDVSPQIRVECACYSKRFLSYHPDLVEDISAKLHDLFYDRDEKVRLEVVKSVCEAAAENLASIPQVLRDDLKERMRDKVWNIRKESISNLARLYRQLMSSSFSSGGPLSNRPLLKDLDWIPTKVLHCYYRDTPEDKLCVERCLLSCIVPINLAEKERMARLVHVYCSLTDVNAIRAFDALLISRSRIRGRLRDLIHAQQDTELAAGNKKQAILSHLQMLARCLPDFTKCLPYLEYLVDVLDDSLMEHLLQAINTSCSCADVINAKVQVLSRVGAKAGVLDAVKSLLDRSCSMLIDASCIQSLIAKACGELQEPSLCSSQEAEDHEFHTAKTTLQLLKVLAGIMPANFASSVVSERLIMLLRHEDTEIVKCTLQIMTLTGVHISKKVTGCLQPILMQLALKGKAELVKDTVKCISRAFREPNPIMDRLYSSVLDSLNYDSDNLANLLIALGQIAKLYPLVFAVKQKQVVRDFIMKKLIVVDRAQVEYVEGDEEWVADDQVSYEAQMKVLAMKLLVNWLLGLSSANDKQCKAVINVLDSTIANDGDLQGQDNISAHDRSRLRLAAACCLLKVAKSSAHKEYITQPFFQRLALTVQDSCEEVRERFVEKLSKYLLSFQLPLDYLSIMVYAGTEPCKTRRNKFQKLMSANVTKRKQCVYQLSKAKENPHAVLPEYAVSHAIYLVAHHPHFSRTTSHKLDKFKDSFWFFLEPMVSRGNSYGFLKKLLETIKTTVDAQDPSNSEANKNLYAACDLAMGVLGTKLTHVSLGDFSGKVILSSALFKSRGKATQPNEMRYLPPEYSCAPTKHPKPYPPITSPTSTAAVAEVSIRATSPPDVSFKASSTRKSSKATSQPVMTAAVPSRVSSTRTSSARERTSKGQSAKKVAVLKKVTTKKKENDSGEEESGVEVCTWSSKATSQPVKTAAIPSRGRNTRTSAKEKEMNKKREEDSDEDESDVEAIETTPASRGRKRSRRSRDAPAAAALNHVRKSVSQNLQVEEEEEEEVAALVKDEDVMKEDSIEEEIKVQAPTRNTRHSKRNHQDDELPHREIDDDITATKKIKLQEAKPATAKKTQPAPEPVTCSIKRRTRPRR